jgi:hypothetical protein
MLQEVFHSEKVHAASGMPSVHDVVSINRGKGYKLREILNTKGKTVKRMRKTLSKKEMNHIMTGNFLPGLWDNCLPNRGVATRKKSRRNSRR